MEKWQVHQLTASQQTSTEETIRMELAPRLFSFGLKHDQGVGYVDPFFSSSLAI